MTDTAKPDPLRLRLDYQVRTGWLQPYLAGLATGTAVAWRCRDCGRTTFPPRRRCPCGCVAGDWTELAGTGTVVVTTTGPGQLPLSEDTSDLTFALIALDGADNLAVGRLAAGRLADARPAPPPGTAVRLERGPAPPAVPWQAGRFAVLTPPKGS